MSELKEGQVEISVSYGRKINTGNYENRSLMDSRKAIVDEDQQKEKRQELYEKVKQSVNESYQQILNKELRTYVCDECDTELEIEINGNYIKYECEICETNGEFKQPPEKRKGQIKV